MEYLSKKNGFKFQFSMDEYDRRTDIQNVFVDTTEISVTKLNDIDKANYQKILKSPNCQQLQLLVENQNQWSLKKIGRNSRRM